MACQDGMIGCFQAKTIPCRSQLSATFPEIQPVSRACACQSARIWKRLDTLSRTVMPSRICCPRQIRATRITRQGDLLLPESGKGGHQDIAPIEDDRREKKAVNHAGHEGGGQNFIKQVSDAVSFLQGRSRICAMLPIRCARPERFHPRTGSVPHLPVLHKMQRLHLCIPPRVSHHPPENAACENAGKNLLPGVFRCSAPKRSSEVRFPIRHVCIREKAAVPLSRHALCSFGQRSEQDTVPVPLFKILQILFRPLPQFLKNLFMGCFSILRIPDSLKTASVHHPLPGQTQVPDPHRCTL